MKTGEIFRTVLDEGEKWGTIGRTDRGVLQKNRRRYVKVEIWNRDLWRGGERGGGSG